MGGGVSGLPSVSEESELPLPVNMEPSEALEEESGEQQAPWAEIVTDQSGNVLGSSPDDVTPPVLPASPPPPHCSLEENTDPLSSMSEPELLPAEKGGETRGLPVAQSEPCILEALAHHSPEEETVVLRKGFRGLGFTIDKSRSGQKGSSTHTQVACMSCLSSLLSFFLSPSLLSPPPPSIPSFLPLFLHRPRSICTLCGQ